MVTIWADSWGNWHAAVQGRWEDSAREVARAAIHDAIGERGAFDPDAVDVLLVRVDGGGDDRDGAPTLPVWTYRECEPGPVLDLDDEQVEWAREWYDGSGSMLYAIASTGALDRGTRRAGVTDVDWDLELLTRLEGELDGLWDVEMTAGDREVFDRLWEDTRREILESNYLVEVYGTGEM